MGGRGLTFAGPVTPKHGAHHGQGEGDKEPNRKHLEDGGEVEGVGGVVVLGNQIQHKDHRNHLYGWVGE